jgi:cell fate regulator YaaT (PSP1 superfamily)
MNVVKIRLRKPRRVFSFLCAELPLNRDDSCIVLSDRGEEWGTCILPPEPCPQEMTKRFSMKVLRRITDKDEKNYAFIEEEERKAREICLKKIKSRHLPMKLVDVEITFDKRKIIFYFTADDRVDFRELVRDLAHDLRARIEMRHIQVRDEAKMVGGIGGCGRELCCSSWMNEFHPISMRMAKAQNLSLNPSKISGQCGRLLCCLSYENEQYEAMRKKARQEAKTKQAEDALKPKVAVEGEATAPAERAARPERRPARPERGDRAERSDRPAPKDRAERPANRERAERPERSRREVPPSDAVAPSEVSADVAVDGDAEVKRSRPRRNRKRKRGAGGGKSGGGDS